MCELRRFGARDNISEHKFFNLQQCCESRYAHLWLKLVEFGSSTQNKVVLYKHDLVQYNLFFNVLKWSTSIVVYHIDSVTKAYLRLILLGRSCLYLTPLDLRDDCVHRFLNLLDNRPDIAILSLVNYMSTTLCM